MYRTQVGPPHLPSTPQPIPRKSIAPMLMVIMEPHGSRALVSMAINQIVECPWEQSSPHSHGPTSLSSSNTNEAIDGDLRTCEQMEVNLKAMVEMASYDSFDIKVCRIR